MHVRSHIDLPGPIAESNRKAGALAMAIQTTLPDIFNQAKVSHQFFQQNVPALVRMFKITREQARVIVGSCPTYQDLALPFMGTGVNSWGLESLQLWQTDVTHYAPFRRLKYIHVSIDTFSGAVFTLAHAGEKAKDVIWHFLLAFSTLSITQAIKRDNGNFFCKEGSPYPQESP